MMISERGLGVGCLYSRRKARRIVMKLRTKTLLMVGLTLVGLLVGVFISAKVIVLGGFEDLEREAVRLNVARARNVLSNELDYLHDTVSDEAAWDDTYAFVQSPYSD